MQLATSQSHCRINPHCWLRALPCNWIRKLFGSRSINNTGIASEHSRPAGPARPVCHLRVSFVSVIADIFHIRDGWRVQCRTIRNRDQVSQAPHKPWSISRCLFVLLAFFQQHTNQSARSFLVSWALRWSDPFGSSVKSSPAGHGFT